MIKLAYHHFVTTYKPINLGDDHQLLLKPLGEAERELPNRQIRLIHWLHCSVLILTRETTGCQGQKKKKKLNFEHNQFSRSHNQLTTSLQEMERIEKMVYTKRLENTELKDSVYNK